MSGSAHLFRRCATVGCGEPVDGQGLGPAGDAEFADQEPQERRGLLRVDFGMTVSSWSATAATGRHATTADMAEIADVLESVAAAGARASWAEAKRLPVRSAP
jgi:hypothetical protein